MDLDELRKMFSAPTKRPKRVRVVASVTTLDELREAFAKAPKPSRVLEEVAKKKRVNLKKMKEARESNQPLPPKAATEGKPFVGRVVISKTGDDAMVDFGKHRGRLMSEVVREDPSYARWVSGNATCPDDLHTLIEWLLENEGAKPKPYEPGKTLTGKVAKSAKVADETVIKAEAAKVEDLFVDDPELDELESMIKSRARAALRRKP